MISGAGAGHTRVHMRAHLSAGLILSSVVVICCSAGKYNGSIGSGGSYSAMGFNGTWNNTTNAAPTSFAVNGVACQ